jgi:hypothetical protein
LAGATVHVPDIGSGAVEAIWRRRVRERTKYGIRAALWLLIAMPTLWFALSLIGRALFNYAPHVDTLIVLMIGFGALAIYNFATMDNRAD